MMLENFETTDFNLYPWTNTATFPWIIDSTGAYDGSACATSFDINDDEASSIEITMNVAANDSIVFFKKLDSEHEAQHQIMECLGQVLWQAQRDASALDTNTYLESLRKLL
jgi:hypothetical protein